ncbi:MAG: hypothetical protein AAFP19_04200 [Bacteroidota bacterium]
MRTKITFLLFSLLSIYACSDVIEEDLSDHQVQLRAPADQVVSSNTSQTFWWEELDEVIDGYKLQIVSPSFDSVVQLVLEEEITDALTFTTTLSAGSYEWTVLAFNTSSESEPMIHQLTIQTDSVLDLSSQVLTLLAPEEGLSTQSTDINFLWEPLSDATTYNIQIASPDFTNSTFIQVNEMTNDDFYTATLTEGDYRWRVRAENDNSVTPYAEGTFSIDQTAPAAPILISPANADSVSLPVSLSWEVDESSTMDTLYVYPDSLVSDPILVIGRTDTNFSFDDSSSDSYFWQLRSVDAAGNVSDFSELRKFFIE